MEGVTDWLGGIGTWLLPAVVVLGFWGGLVWLVLRFRLAVRNRSATEGRLARGSILHGNLPLHYDFAAHLGTGGPAPTTLGEKLLRPSFGVKLVVLGVSAMVVGYCLNPAFWQAEFNPLGRDGGWLFATARVLLPLAALYGVLYIFTSEARYDRDVLIVTRFFSRREFRWKHLSRITDGGTYDLVLTFAPGGRAKVLKHSTGVRDFKDFALAQVRKNRMEDA